MRISDWSSDVCSSDLDCGGGGHANASSLFARCFRGASGAPAADAPRFLGLDRCAVHAGPHDQPEPVACLCGCGGCSTEVRWRRCARLKAERPPPLSSTLIDLCEEDRKSTRLNSSH